MFDYQAVKHNRCTFMHLADAYMQSDLHCIDYPLAIEPMTWELLVEPCYTGRLYWKVYCCHKK